MSILPKYSTMHVLNPGTVMDTMDIVKTRKKGKNLNTLEKYNVYRTSKDTLE
jgi:hypothetical protein